MITQCTNCGAPIEPVDSVEARTEDEHCDDCNDRFYAAMRVQYPHGQCQRCGEGYREWLCEKHYQHGLICACVDGYDPCSFCESEYERRPNVEYFPATESAETLAAVLGSVTLTGPSPRSNAFDDDDLDDLPF